MAGARGFLSKPDLLLFDVPRLLRAVMDSEMICARPNISALVERLTLALQMGHGYRPV